MVARTGWASQELYTLTSTRRRSNGALRTGSRSRFGIREVTSELTDGGPRLFKVNGKPMLVRGGGWASDMLLRPKSTERLEARAPVRAGHGPQHHPPRGQARDRRVLRLARSRRHPRHGRLVLLRSAGRNGTSGTPRTTASAPASLRDQMLRLRSHPSVFVWLNGSDFPPPAEVEQAYLDVLEGAAVAERRSLVERDRQAGTGDGPERREDARARTTTCRRRYWLDGHEARRRVRVRDRDQPGRRGAADREPAGRCCPRSTSGRSTRSGTSTPAAASSRTSKLLHRRRSRRATARPTGAEDYARKSQALTYEGQRAMFEAYARNKYTRHRRDPVDAQQRLAVDRSGTSTTTTCGPAAATSARRRRASRCTSSTRYDDR